MTTLPGIGKTLEEKIQAMVDTGTIPALGKLRDRIPPGLAAITRLPGVGPKRVRAMYDQLGIDSIDALREAAETGRLRDAKGFGVKFEESVLAALEAGAADKPAQRMVLPAALEVGEQVAEALRAHPAAVHVEIAGSARRLADSVKDLDIVAAATDPAALAAALAGVDALESAGTAGENAARGRAHNGLGIDLRVVEPDQFGNLLQHFTGSARHNVALREAAVRRGVHISEYGILDDETGETMRCATEEEVYERLGLPWIPPELREDRGELAKGFEVPRLVTVEDLRGDLHCHTTLSDGRSTLEEMARTAQARGYEYLAITDHSATHGFGDHVTPDELRRQIERVRALDEEIDGMHLLVGTETNILPDGRPDYDDELLAELDWVVGSVHTSFNMTEKNMTARMVAAIEHPWIDAIGHPTGPQDRQARAVQGRRRRAHRGGGPHRDDARDQRRAGPPRPQRRPRARRGRGGREHPHRLRRPRRRAPRAREVGGRDRAARVARPRADREHAAVEGVRGVAQAGEGCRVGSRAPLGSRDGVPRRAQRWRRSIRSIRARRRPPVSPSNPPSAAAAAAPAPRPRRPRRPRTAPAPPPPPARSRRGARPAPPAARPRDPRPPAADPAPGRSAAPRTAPAPAS